MTARWNGETLCVTNELHILCFIHVKPSIVTWIHLFILIIVCLSIVQNLTPQWMGHAKGYLENLLYISYQRKYIVTHSKLHHSVIVPPYKPLQLLKKNHIFSLPERQELKLPRLYPQRALDCIGFTKNCAMRTVKHITRPVGNVHHIFYIVRKVLSFSIHHQQYCRPSCPNWSCSSW